MWLHKKPCTLRRMRIALRCRRADVMVAVVGRPPQRAALHAGGADAGERELHGARGAEGAVRKVAVIEAGDREHAHARTVRRRRRAPAARRRPRTRQAGHVQRHERRSAQPVDAVGAGPSRVHGAAVDPAAQCARLRSRAKLPRCVPGVWGVEHCASPIAGVMTYTNEAARRMQARWGNRRGRANVILPPSSERMSCQQ